MWKFAEAELGRHDEIWATGGKYVRQELLEALGKENGLDIPISNAIPSSTMSDARMVKILTYSLYHRDGDLYRNFPFERPTCHQSLNRNVDILESIDRLSKETRNIAKRICEGGIFDGCALSNSDHDGNHGDAISLRTLYWSYM